MIFTALLLTLRKNVATVIQATRKLKTFVVNT